MAHSHASPFNSNPVAKLLNFLLAPLGNYADKGANEAQTDRIFKTVPLEKNKFDIEKLDKTIEHRRSVIEMVAHDIRSPLMSAQISIDLVEEYCLEISDQGYLALGSAQSKLEFTLRQAKHLLNCFNDKRIADLEPQPLNKLALLDNAKQKSSAQDVTQAMSFLTQALRLELASALKLLQKFECLENERLSLPCRKHLFRAQSGIKRSLSLINDQLRMEYLLKDSVYLEKSACLLSDITEDAIASLKGLAEKKQIKIINNCFDESVIADRGRITQVLINYLSNAIKFSKLNTDIIVSCRELPQSVHLAVSDQGPGLDKQTKEHIFERLTQTAAQDKNHGCGLGLSICKLIVEAHGGQLGVDSKPGKGSSFWLELPK